MRNAYINFRTPLSSMLNAPGFLLVAVLSLALGIGVNTGIFSVVNAVLLEDPPYRNAEELVLVWETFPFPGGRGKGSVSVPTFDDWKEGSDAFDTMAAFVSSDADLRIGDLFLEAQAVSVTGELFDLLGRSPARGRYILQDDIENNTKVAVLSHGLWQDVFGNHEELVGKEIMVNGESHSIVGVMGPQFQFPPFSKEVVWTPLTFTPEQKAQRTNRWIIPLARLAEGRTLQDAQNQLEHLTQNLAQRHPDVMEGRGVQVQSLKESMTAESRPTLLAIWAVGGLIFLIACANVANLLLARTAARRKEFALRAALGGGRSTLVRQVLTESLVLAMAGGLVGLLAGHWTVSLMAASPGFRIARGADPALNFKVFLVALLIVVVGALLSGFVPALRASKIDLNNALRSTGQIQGGGSRRDFFRSALVVSELALALTALICAFLILMGFLALQEVDSGLHEPENVLVMRVPLRTSHASSPEAARGFFQQLLENVNAVPGIRSAGLITRLPVQEWGTNGEFSIEGRPPASAAEQPFAEFRIVSPGYFETMGIPLIRGQLFVEETRDLPRVLINESLAERYWPGEDPVGGRLALGTNADSSSVWLTVVGVVGDVKNAGLHQETRGEYYFDLGQAFAREMWLVARTQLPPSNLAAAVRGEISKLDPQQPILQVKSMRDVISTFLSRHRFTSVLFICCAALALLLAVSGVYGVIAYGVNRRTREIGLRMALGARRGEVLGLILRQSFVLAIVGAGIGLAAAFVFTRLLSSQLFEVEPDDPLVYAAATVVLVGTALLACLVPARRASGIEPTLALREE